MRRHLDRYIRKHGFHAGEKALVEASEAGLLRRTLRARVVMSWHAACMLARCVCSKPDTVQSLARTVMQCFN